MHGNDQPENQRNPYLNTDYNSLYNFDPKEETFSDTEDTRIRSYTVQAKEAVQSNQSAKTAKLSKIVKLWIIMENLFTDLSDYEIIKEPKYTLKAETETATEPRLVVGVETPLGIMSIAL